MGAEKERGQRKSKGKRGQRKSKGKRRGRERSRENKSYFFMSTSVALCREVLPSYTDIAR